MDILEQAKKEIAALIADAAGASVSVEDLVLPPDVKMGDLSFPCFKLAKELKKNPSEIAKELKNKIKPQGMVAKIEIAGPYLNFFLKREEVAQEILKSPPIPLFQRGKKAILSRQRFSPFRKGRVREGFSKKERQRGIFQGQCIMIEFISPNNNKPLHLGHLRNAFLGESVARLLESQGAKVMRACLFNDRGLAIAKSMVAYKLWGKGTTPEKLKVKGDKFVGDLYVQFEKKAQVDKRLLNEAEKIVVLWEKGDKATRALWQKLNNWAMAGFEDTFKRLGIKFNISYFESALWQKGKKLVKQGVKKGIFKKDETGVVLADLSAQNLPPKVMLRADGTAIYSTSDLYLGQEKFSKKKLARGIWCVGSEQELYLKQLFTIYKKFSFPWAGHCEHLSYGLVFLPEGKMKSREGKVVEADDLLNELYNLAIGEILKRNAAGEVGSRVAPAAETRPRGAVLSASMKKRAEIIAQAALRFYLLSVTPKTIVHFNPKESISFTGRTGPYLLYTYARIASILRKAAGRDRVSTAPRRMTGAGETWSQRAAQLQISDIEWNLIFKLAQFQDMVRQAAINCNPAILAQYLYDLAKIFSDFYEAVPILKAELKDRTARLALIKAVKNTMAQGLRLLTIEPVERM